MDFVEVVVVDARERHYRERIRLEGLRNHSKPFELTDTKFIKIFRIPKFGARLLIETLDDPRLDKGYIPKTMKVLAALKFFAQGSYQTSIAQDNFLNVSQPSLSRFLDVVVDGIVNKLAPLYIKFPQTEAEKDLAKAEFQELYNMPNTLGAVDGTHIAIAKPPINHPTAPGNLFYNRKGFYSINCQIVCSGSGKVIGLNPNFPGSTHDAAIWGASRICHYLREEYVQGVSNQWLLGDKGYPLQPWLMIPVSNPTGHAEEAYNACHIRARNVVEMTIGRIKNKFRCLHRHRCLHYQPEKAAKIIIACCTLYNMYKDHFSEVDDEENEGDEDERPVVDDNGMDILAQARAIREALIQNHFGNN